jgi:hypothetical protein
MHINKLSDVRSKTLDISLFAARFRFFAQLLQNFALDCLMRDPEWQMSKHSLQEVVQPV